MKLKKKTVYSSKARRFGACVYVDVACVLCF